MSRSDGGATASAGATSTDTSAPFACPTSSPQPSAATARSQGEPIGHLHAGRTAVLAGETAHRVQGRGGGQAGVADRERRVGPPGVAARRAQPPRPERLVDLRGPCVGAQSLQPDDRGERGSAGRRGRHGPHRDHGRAFDTHRPPPGLHDHGAGPVRGQLADRVGEERPAVALPDAVSQRHPGAYQVLRDLHASIVRCCYDGIHT